MLFFGCVLTTVLEGEWPSMLADLAVLGPKALAAETWDSLCSIPANDRFDLDNHCTGMRT